MSESMRMSRRHASTPPPDPPADLPPPRDLGVPHRVLTDGVEPEPKPHTSDQEHERS